MNITRIILAGAVSAIFLSQPFQLQAATYDVDNLPTILGGVDPEDGIAQAAGQSMASGDINGDGYADLIIGAPTLDGVIAPHGNVYLMYGGSATEVDQDLSSAIRFSINNTAALFGSAVATGDINGDGYDDIIVGAYLDCSATTEDLCSSPINAGSVYIIYGQSSELSTTTITASNASLLQGNAIGDYFGYSVTAADINNDGADDVLVGAPRKNSNDEGGVYLIYGTVGSRLEDTTMSGSNILFRGASGDEFGTTVSHVGDINNDGYEDIAASSIYGGADDYGHIYLLYGRSAQFSTNLISNVAVRFRGEFANDYAHIISNGGDINNDGYDDFLVGVPTYDSGRGRVYIVTGSSSNYTTNTVLSSFVSLTGAEESDFVGLQVALGEINNDNYADLLIATSHITGEASNDDAVVLVPGSANLISSTLTEGYLYYYDGTSDSWPGMGGSLVFGDLNGDGFLELLISNPSYYSGYGAVYVLYNYIDQDGDGVPGTDGVTDGTDCDDNDASGTALATYYLDNDGDDLGTGTGVILCSDSVPAGYADNADDNNDNDFDNDGIEDPYDDVVNADYEIGGDGKDNDGDGEVDETNSLEENGIHTGYDELDPENEETATETLTRVRGRKNGKIKVTYSDGSSYIYTIFSGSSTRKTKVKQYDGSGYLVVLQSNSKKIALVNAYTGEVYNRKTVHRQARRYAGLKLLDVRNDDVTEAVVTNRKNDQVQVAIFKVNTTNQRLKKRSSLKLTNERVDVSKTKKKRNKVLLRNSSNSLLQRLNTNSDYQLTLAD